MFRLGAINDELSFTLEGSLNLAVKLGIRDLEIHTVGRKTIEDLEMDEVDQLQKKLAERDLCVSNISSTIFLRCHLDDRKDEIAWRTAFRSIEGTYDYHLSRLERSLQIAQKLHSPFVRIFGFWQDGPAEEDVYEKIAERLQKPLEMARLAGIRLVLENCPHTFLDWGERAAHLLRQVNSPWLMMLLDPCAGQRSGEPDICQPYPDILPFLGHVHAKDFLFDNADQRGHAYVPVGQGIMPWKKILACLARDGYEGVVSIETHHLASDGTKETAAIATYQGLQKIFQQTIHSTDREGAIQ